MELADLEKLIKTRRSIRRWKDQTVPEELLITAVELATWAPNGGNQQNWRFYIIVNRDIIKAIADAVQVSDDVISSWPESAGVGYASAGPPRPAGYFETAPAAIAVAAARYQSPTDRILEARGKTDQYAVRMRQWRNIADSRVQSVASAVAHLLLVLHQMGLGTVWMTGPVQAKSEIEAILKVPSGLDLIAFIPIGYPDETPVSRGRKPVSEVSEVIR
ncbi:MAG: nitroreductase family protein [Dehalococcoidales bacterium]|nr:nitroreductase family protein [Dehalococcoidales bacterium]